MDVLEFQTNLDLDQRIHVMLRDFGMFVTVNVASGGLVAVWRSCIPWIMFECIFGRHEQRWHSWFLRNRGERYPF